MKRIAPVPHPRLLIGARETARRLLALAVVSIALFGARSAQAQATYTANRSSTDWTNSGHWTPTRTTPAATDIMVVDGAITPTVTLTKVPTQTIGRLRIINNATVTMSASANGTLTITNGATPNLDIPAGSSLTVSGSSAISMSFGATATGNIAGNLTLQGGAHRLLAASSNTFTFQSGARLTTGSNFSGNVFGNSGTANVATFTSGSFYVHGAGSDPFALSAPSSKVTFQPGSEAIWRANVGFPTGGRTFSDLRVQNNASLSASNSGPLVFRNLNVESGSSFALSGSGSSSVTIGGNVSSAGSGAMTIGAGSGGILFSSGGVQTIGTGGGSGTVTLSGTATIPAGTTLAASRTLAFSSGSMIVNGTFRIDGGAGATGNTGWTYGPGSLLVFNHPSGAITVASTSNYWPASNSAANITVQGPGTITMGSGATRTVSGTFQTAAAVSGANLLTFTGTARLNPGGAFAAAPIYGAASTLLYNGAFTVGPEWGAGSVIGAGVPANVTIQAGAGTVTMPSTARTVGGTLTIASGTLALNAVSGDLSVAGNWSNAGTFTPNGRKVIFTGAATQTLARTGGETFARLDLTKSGGAVQLLDNLTLTGAGGINALEMNGTVDVLDLNGRQLTLTGAVAGTDAAGSIKGSATSGLVLNGTGALGTLRFTAGSQTLGTLVVNRTTSGSVTLGSALTVASTLTLTDGLVTTGANTLTANGTVTRTNGYVVGRLGKNVPAGSPTVTFEIGSSGNYLPMTLLFSNVSTPGGIVASTTNGDHPNLATSGFIAAKTLNRYYTLTGAGVVYDSLRATLRFVAGDVDPGAVVDSFDVRRFAGAAWSTPRIDSRTTTSLDVAGITALGDFAAGELNKYTITSSSGANGTVVPLGTLTLKAGTNPVYTMVPASRYHVVDVLVDGVSVGAVTSYTFANLSASHTISATFAIDMFPLTVVVNGLGVVTRDQNQATYPSGTFIVLTATPDVGWEFTGWTGHVFTQFNPVGFLIDSAMTVNATFVRQPLGYTRSLFTSTYTSLSTATGATKLLATADDSTRSVALPFPFIYSGVPFGTNNFLAVNANGFAFFSRSNVTASLSSQSSNTNLYNASTPNTTLAPWYDDLAVGAVGTNPGGSVLYQLQGAPGSGRSFTIQWTNVSSYNSAASGQPRQLNFQLVLYETSNLIEFRYGPATGSTSSGLESASIGLEDTLGGNNQYLDAVTGSRLTNHGMMTSNKWPTRHFRFTPGVPAPLPGGTYQVGLGQTFAGISQAVAELNHRGIAGPVTLQLVDALYDTTAARGNTSFPVLLGPVAGSSAVNTITIQPGSGTSVFRSRGTEAGNCGNQLLGSVIGTTNEPVFGLIGADYVTIRNVNFEGSSTVDRGLLLLPSSNIDGAQNNTFENIGATLARINPLSIGIQQFMSSTPLTPEGTNSFNRYYNLNVLNCFAGVSIAGSGGFFDTNNEIGVTAGGVSRIGGVVSGDIGNGPGQTFGIRALNEANLRIYGQEVRNLVGTGTSPVDGISLENPSTSSSSSGLCEIYGNNVHDLRSNNAGGGRVTGIRVNLTANGSSVSRVYNNQVVSLYSQSTSTSSRRIVGIFAQESGNGAGATHNVDFNSVRIAPTDLTASNACFEIGTVTGPVIKVRNNAFGNFTGTQSGAAKHFCWVSPSAGSIGPAGSLSDRNVLHVSNAANGFVGLAGGIDKPTVADWQTVAGSDIASPSANPQFIAPGNVHISASNPTPVEGNGSFFNGDISWVTTDLDNQSRSATTPDIGADEGAFQPLVTNDMSAASFVNPSAGATVNVGITFAPQATFENTGLVTQTSVPVRFQILGPSPSTTVVYDQTGTVPSIAVGQSQSVTFPSTSIANAGIYTMLAIAQLSGDQNAVNDSLESPLDMAGPLAGTLRVGVNEPAPFNTLTSAITRLNAVGLAGPATFELADSTYGAAETFPIILNTLAGSSATNTFTLRPAPGATVLVTGSTTRGVLVLNGADNVVIDGSNTVGGTTRNLTFQNTNSSAASAVLWAQTTQGGDPVTNDVIRNVETLGNDNSQTLFGIGFGGPTIAVTGSGTNNHNNRIQNCRVRRTQWGLFTSGASAAVKNNGTVITENVMDGTAGDNLSRGGILARFENNLTISRNRIENVANGINENAIGIALGYTAVSSELFDGDEVTNATVSQNRIRGVVSSNVSGASAAGITLAAAASGTTTIVNNMIAGVLSPSHDPDLTVGILVGGGAATTRVWFNSVSMTGDRGAATAPSFALAIGGTNPVVDARDNALANTQVSSSVGDGYLIGLAYLPSYDNLVSNYNVLYSTTGQFAVIGGLTNTPDGDRTTRLAWQNETGEDANSTTGDPKFASATDLHISQASSSAAGMGQAIAGVTVDIDDETGNRAATPDIGADEFITYPINFTIVGNGSVTKNPNQVRYGNGDVVELTAVPGVGSHFVSWSGDLTGTANPASVTITAARNITVTFALDTFTLTAAAVDSGTVTRTPSQALYDYGTAVQLAATARPHYHFVNWTGDTTATANPLDLVITRNRSLNGNFAIDTYALDVTVPGGHGTVAKSPDLAQYGHGSSVQLTPVPATGYHFVNWGGDAGGGTTPLTVVMDGPKTITATFAINTYALNATVLGSGSVTKSPDQAAYDHGTVVQITAVPAVGYHFVGWGGDAVGPTNPINVTMDAVKNVTATFAINRYAVNLTTAGDGTVAKAPNQAEYDHGSVVQLTATPGAGNAFLGWSGDATGAANPLALTVDAVKNVIATFSYKVDAVSGGNGTVVKSPNQPNYAPGTSVQITATPAAHYHFVGWSGAATGTTNPITLVADANKTVTATFAIDTHALALTIAGDGSVAKAPNQALYDYGSAVQLTATPGAGNAFLGWSGAATGTANPVSVTMNGDQSVTATFTFRVDATSGGNGTVAKSPNQPNYAPGTSVQLTATPAANYHFANWSGDASGTDNPLTVTATANKTIVANFAIDTYALDLSTLGDGVVAKSPDQATYAHGSVVQLTPTPGAGNAFLGWSGDASGAASPLSVTMDGPKTIVATFTYRIDVATVGSGTVVKSPNLPNHPPGSTVSLTATPAASWHFVEWTGAAPATSNPVSVVASQNQTVTATFALNDYTLGVPITGAGTVNISPNLPSYSHGATVQLTAVPDAGHSFIGWSDGATGSTNPLTIVMNSSKTVRARFTSRFNAVAVGSGSVSFTPVKTAYLPGDSVTISATPLSGNQFVGFTGDVFTDFNPVKVAVDSNMTVNANFVPGSDPAINLTIVGSGTVAKSPDQATYKPGSNVLLTATPGALSHFVGWSGDVVTTQNPITVYMDRDKDITATFVRDAYVLTTAAGTGGTVARAPNQPNYTPGTHVLLTPTPDAGFVFVGWSGDATGSAAPLDVTMDADKSITGLFGHTLTTLPATGGQIHRSLDAPSYVTGAVVTLTATPGSGYRFTGWTGDASGTQNPLPVTLNANKTVGATFVKNDYALHVLVEGNGSAVASPDPPTYPYGTLAHVFATPATGWHFVRWNEGGGERELEGGPGRTYGCGDCASPFEAAFDVLMDAERTVVAVFAVDSVAIGLVGNGHVMQGPAPLEGDAAAATLTAQPDAGFRFAGWSGDATGESNPLRVAGGRRSSYTATFVEAVAPVVTLEGGATLTPDAGGAVEIAWRASDAEGIASVAIEVARADGGWERVAAGLPESGSRRIADRTRAGAAQLRVVALDRNGNLGSAGVAVAGALVATAPLPERVELRPITPNPARGPVGVEFSLPGQAQVRLSIVDVQGREVASLADGAWPAGLHRAVWNGATRGGPAAPGLYFVRLRTGGREWTQRLVLAR